METPLIAASLRWLFTEWPLAERFCAAAACGFRAVDLSLPYELPLPELRESLLRHDLRFLYLLAAPGDWGAGDRGLAAVPGRQEEFRAGMHEAIRYASGLGRPLIHPPAGNLPEGADSAESAHVLFENLRWACAQASEHGLRLVLEPVCRRDFPKYPINTVSQVIDLAERIGAANLGIVLDFHHVQWEHGHDMARVHAELLRAMPLLWYVQIAFAPDRLGPDEAGHDVHATIAEAQRLGYSGAFSCEYRPAGSSPASLRWADRYGIRVIPGRQKETQL